MLNKRKAAWIAAAVCAVVAICGAVYTTASKRNRQPEISNIPQESAGMATEPVYTDPQKTAPVTEPPAQIITTQPSQPAVAEEKQTESQTVSGSLPRPDYFELPLGLDIVSDYSDTEPVFSATMGDWRTHCGVDFGGVVGDPVKASAAGFVTAVYDDPMYGVVMEIDHGGGVVAKYCGLGKGSTIPVGTEVKTNDTIGHLGTVPCEAQIGAHLHMEMIDNGKNVDPLLLFDLA